MSMLEQTGAIEAGIASIIVQITGWPADDIGSDFEFFHNGVLDSLGVVELVSAVEDELGVALREEDLLDERFSTVGGLAMIVAERRQS